MLIQFDGGRREYFSVDDPLSNIELVVNYANILPTIKSLQQTYQFNGNNCGDMICTDDTNWNQRVLTFEDPLPAGALLRRRGGLRNCAQTFIISMLRVLCTIDEDGDYNSFCVLQKDNLDTTLSAWGDSLEEIKTLMTINRDRCFEEWGLLPGPELQFEFLSPKERLCDELDKRVFIVPGKRVEDRSANHTGKRVKDRSVSPLTTYSPPLSVVFRLFWQTSLLLGHLLHWSRC